MRVSRSGHQGGLRAAADDPARGHGGSGGGGHRPLAQLYPERSTHDLAGWLAARQLFVALICTTATLLAEPELIAIPFSSTEITGGFALKAFTIIWNGLTLLWFMQIFPKHMAATNPDRYLKFTRRALFPIVEVVRKIGIALPAEWVAKAVQNRLDWHAEPTLEKETPPRQAESLAERLGCPDPGARARDPAARRPGGGPGVDAAHSRMQRIDLRSFQVLTTTDAATPGSAGLAGLRRARARRRGTGVRAAERSLKAADRATAGTKLSPPPQRSKPSRLKTSTFMTDGQAVFARTPARLR